MSDDHTCLICCLILDHLMVSSSFVVCIISDIPTENVLVKRPRLSHRFQIIGYPWYTTSETLKSLLQVFTSQISSKVCRPPYAPPQKKSPGLEKHRVPVSNDSQHSELQAPRVESHQQLGRTQGSGHHFGEAKSPRWEANVKPPTWERIPENWNLLHLHC